MAAIALMLEIFLFLRLIVTVPAVAAVTITSAAQWSIEEAWVGYISTAGSYSPAYCNSGSVYVGWTSIFGCDPMGYVNWPLTNTFLGCDGSGVLLGSLQDTICDGGVWQDPDITTTITSHFSGTCNTNTLYSRVGDQIPMYLNYACMTGTPRTWYRELLATTSTTDSAPPSANPSTTVTDILTLTSSKVLVGPHITAFSTAAASSTSQTTPTQTASPNPSIGTKRLAVGLGLGLGIPSVALAFFFCCSYRRISVSVKIRGPEPPPAYSDGRGGVVPGRVVQEVISQEAGIGAKKDEEGGKAGMAVGYK